MENSWRMTGSLWLHRHAGRNEEEEGKGEIAQLADEGCWYCWWGLAPSASWFSFKFLLLVLEMLFLLLLRWGGLFWCLVNVVTSHSFCFYCVIMFDFGMLITHAH